MTEDHVETPDGENQGEHLGNAEPANAAGVTGAIPMPPVNDSAPLDASGLDHATPVTPSEPFSNAIAMPPVTPLTPTEGTMTPPAGTLVPTAGAAGGAYALGALSGNPHLGGASADQGFTPPSGYTPPAGYGPPTGQVPPMWTPASDAGAAPSNNHRMRNILAVTGAVVVALAAGAGISHAAWKANTPTQSAAPSTNQNANPFGSGFGGGEGGSNSFGSGSSGSSGSSGNSSNSGGSGPSDVSAIAAKVDPGLVDINTTLGYQSEQAAGTGIVLTSSAKSSPTTTSSTVRRASA